MTPYAVFKTETGEMLRSGVCQPADLPLQVEDGEAAYATDQVYSDDTHYANGGEVVPRPTMSLVHIESVLAGEAFRIDGIPVGTTVIHPEGEVTVDDGFVEQTFSEPGVYEYTLINFPYLEEKVSATVTQP